jgi:hypothetical protein
MNYFETGLFYVRQTYTISLYFTQFYFLFSSVLSVIKSKGLFR